MCFYCCQNCSKLKIEVILKGTKKMSLLTGFKKPTLLVQNISLVFFPIAVLVFE